MEVKGHTGPLPGRNPYTLAPFGNTSLIGGANGVLPLGERRKPKMTLRIGFRSFKMAALRVLQSYSGVSDRLVLGVHDLATDCAEPSRSGSRKASDSQNRA